MIKTKQELATYIEADLSRYHLRKTAFHYYLFGDETFAVIRFLKRYRKTEYYYNTYNKRNPLSLLRFAVSFFLYRRKFMQIMAVCCFFMSVALMMITRKSY